MNADSTAQRYAEALFGIGQSSGKLAVFQQNAEDFLRVLKDSRELMTSLSHPNIRREQRKAIINEVLSDSPYDHVFSNFVRLVVDRGRIMYFPRIVSSFVGLRDDADGRLRGTVYSATPLSDIQMSRLKSKVEAKLGHEVIFETRIDASLIGGLRVEINGRVFDSSVKHHLEKMRENMMNSDDQ